MWTQEKLCQLSEKWNAKAIRDLRGAYGERQDEFCFRLGVGVGAYRNYEQGRLNGPSGPVLILLEMLEEQVLISGKRPA